MAISAGSNSSESKNNSRCCDQSCPFLIRSYKLSPYCESTSDEPSVGNLHAGFCESRRWVTASARSHWMHNAGLS